MKQPRPKQPLHQPSLPFVRRGGARPGAGRKPTGERAGVSHRRRPRHSRHTPLHVTWRLCAGLPSLRRRRETTVVLESLRAGAERFGFRLVHFSVQGTHLHLIVEAEDRRELSRGLQGLGIRIAKRLNRLWARAGRVLSDRYHEHALKTPREVRNALRYVLNNHRRHGLVTRGPDPCSSGAWFDGWVEGATALARDLVRPVAAARCWLLTVGWRRHGRIALDEVPGG